MKLIAELSNDVLLNEFGLKLLDEKTYNKLYRPTSEMPIYIRLVRVEASEPNYVWDVYTSDNKHPTTQVKTKDQLRKTLFILTYFERETFA